MRVAAKRFERSRLCSFCIGASVVACAPAARSPTPAPVPTPRAAAPTPGTAPASGQATASARERISLDRGFRFALGHATDPEKDFGHGKSYFSYLAKAGFADGPADVDFDDRGFRQVDLPHDWAVELPFDAKRALVRTAASAAL